MPVDTSGVERVEVFVVVVVEISTDKFTVEHIEMVCTLRRTDLV